MSSTDQYDKLEAACRTPNSYPANLLRSQSFQHSLQAYRRRLREQQDDLFDSNTTYHEINFLEAYDGEKEFHDQRCRSVADLQSLFKIERKDPRCRHVFIQAEHSRAPLDCSMEMFLLILSFHQVMPRFLDFVFGFGRQNLAKGFHYTAFRHENFLSSRQAKSYEIPRLGRSGLELRQSYNLWSVEKSSPNWSIRQTAVYHSFDLNNGRTLWLNIKANSIMKDRITEATSTSDPMLADSSRDPARSFAATLVTHLIFFEWCAENWRSYISSLETNLRKVLSKVQNAPLRKVESALTVDPRVLLRTLSRTGSMPPQATNRSNTLPKSNTFSSQSTASGGVNSWNQSNRVLSGMTVNTADTVSDRIQSPTPLLKSPTSEKSAIGHEAPGTMEDNQFEVFKQFSFDEMQRLDGIGSDLHEAKLVMGLNSEVLSEITAYYQTMITAVEFPTVIKDGCSQELADFFQQIKSTIRELQMEQSRIDALMMMLEDGKRLFDGILQFRNIEISKLFAVNAHESGLQMEAMTRDMHEATFRMEDMTKSMNKIAEKTERETASMHIITLVTLVFLPGTFVAVRFGLPYLCKFIEDLTSDQTFFGSGLFQWDQNKPLDFPVWKPEFFALFAKICFPLMGGTILIFLIPYFWTYLGRWRKTVDDEEKLSMSSVKGALDVQHKGTLADITRPTRRCGVTYCVQTIGKFIGKRGSM